MAASTCSTDMPVFSAIFSRLFCRAVAALLFRPVASRAALAAAFLPPSRRPEKGFSKLAKGEPMPSCGKMPNTPMTTMKAKMSPMKALMILLSTGFSLSATPG